MDWIFERPLVIIWGILTCLTVFSNFLFTFFISIVTISLISIATILQSASPNLSLRKTRNPLNPQMLDWCKSIGLPELSSILSEKNYYTPDVITSVNKEDLKQLTIECFPTNRKKQSQFFEAVQILRQKLESERTRKNCAIFEENYHQLEMMKDAPREKVAELKEKIKQSLVDVETERLKVMIENTITTPAKSLPQIIKDIQQTDMNSLPHSETVKESLILLAEAFASEGIELDPTNNTDQSDLRNLHSLSDVELTKVELSFDRSPIDDSSPDEILNNPKKSAQFKDTMRSILALKLNVPVESVHIVNLTKGSIKFVTIIGHAFLSTQKKDDVDNAIKLFDLKNKVCGILETHFGKKGKPKSIDVAPFKKPLKLRICAKDFDERGDINFPTPTGEKQQRGGIVYYQPSNQWVRRGLSVLDLYKDNEWISMSGVPGEWAVGFHGTLSSGETGLTSIATTRFFGVGSAHACENNYSNAPFTQGQKYGGIAERAIYFTKDIESCYKLHVKRGSDNYEIAFQCRINPKFFYDDNPSSPGNYCIVRGPENIRPYGVCIKKV